MKTPKLNIPIDPNDWTVEDWRELYEGIESIKQRIAARHVHKHSPKQYANQPPVDNAHVAPGCEQFESGSIESPLNEQDIRTPLRDLGRPFHEGKQIGWQEGKQPLEERKEAVLDELKIMLALAGAQGWKSPEEFQELRTQLEEAQRRAAMLKGEIEFVLRKESEGLVGFCGMPWRKRLEAALSQS